jgi:hypothetical protein
MASSRAENLKARQEKLILPVSVATSQMADVWVASSDLPAIKVLITPQTSVRMALETVVHALNSRIDGGWYMYLHNPSSNLIVAISDDLPVAAAMAPAGLISEGYRLTVAQNSTSSDGLIAESTRIKDVSAQLRLTISNQHRVSELLREVLFADPM